MLRRTVREPDPADSEGEDSGAAPRRRIGGWTTTALLLLFGLAFAGIAVLRIVGIDGNVITVPAVALTPYVAPGAVLLFLIAFALRRRILAVAVLALGVVMVLPLLPRMVANDQPAVHGQHVRVLAANVNDGKADPAALVKLVRDNNVDVLNLPELTRSELPVLDSAGLATLLPYRVLDPGIGADGSGILSRFPLRQTVLVEAIELSEPSAIVDLPGRDDIEILAAHVQSAAHGDAGLWRRELSRLPSAAPDRIRILAGDFNSTLDHAAFRQVIDHGYVDAAEQTGKGLTTTWSSLPFGPPIAIDHVLVDHHCAIQTFSVLDLPGSDHNAVFADIVLPG